jgi:peptidoglycan/xylan/chitin deacetylase (PgdA/CDA1 family)
VFIIFAGCIAVLLYFGFPLIYGRWARLLLRLKIKRQPCLVLTFDDGISPGASLTTAILDILAEYRAKATFFLLGEHIPGREQVIQRIRIEGHEIASHGYNHPNYCKVSPLRALRDINRGWRAIDNVLGVNQGTYLFRPPYGKLNFICLLYLWIRRTPIVYWTFDIGDTWPAGKRNAQRIAAFMEKSQGAVVLAHDFDRKDRETSKMVLESVRSVLARAKEKGMPVLTVSEFLRGYDRR